MTYLNLAWKSIWNRRTTTLLTLFSIALSTALLISVEKMRAGAQQGFTNTISQTDLIVGARTGPINLLLYTVFNMGSASNNIGYDSYQKFLSHPAVEWTIPYSLGDGHHGYRVVATNGNFFEHYRFRGDKNIVLRQGEILKGLWDVVLGAEVADKLGYKLGDAIVVTHGVTNTEGFIHHDDKPFRVVGIMERTGTALDQSLYITLEGMEAIHMDWKDGAAPQKGAGLSPDKIKIEDIKVGQITAFFLRTKSRIETLRLQREINTYVNEPLLAIIPGVTLSEIWRGMGYIEQTLKLISWLVVGVGLIAMLISILTSLNERRREMAILRAVGAGPKHVLFLLMFESALLVFFGVLLGEILQIAAFAFLDRYLQEQFGIYLSGHWFSAEEFQLLAIALVIGCLAGLLPALRAVQMSLKDGLRQTT